MDTIEILYHTTSKEVYNKLINLGYSSWFIYHEDEHTVTINNSDGVFNKFKISSNKLSNYYFTVKEKYELITKFNETNNIIDDVGQYKPSIFLYKTLKELNKYSNWFIIDEIFHIDDTYLVISHESDYKIFMTSRNVYGSEHSTFYIFYKVHDVSNMKININMTRVEDIFESYLVSDKRTLMTDEIIEQFIKKIIL